MHLNRTLIKYSSVQVVQIAFQEMQKAAFKVADLLISKGDGAVANIAGHDYWVTPLNGAFEIAASPDIGDEVDRDYGSYNVFLNTSIEGIGEYELNQIRDEMNAWLENPTFIFKDQDSLNALVYHWYGSEQKCEALN